MNREKEPQRHKHEFRFPYIRRFYIGVGLYGAGQIVGALVMPTNPDIGRGIGDISIICGLIGSVTPIVGGSIDGIRRIALRHQSRKGTHA